MFNITEHLTFEEFQVLFPNVENPQAWYDALVEILPQYDINTPERISAFLAQCSHESNGFTVLEENLNYSKERLRVIFPKYFPDEATAAYYARKPVLIASRTYANRMGNGPEESADGWKYRGRGILQLTGKDNYARFSEAMLNNPSLVEKPDLLTVPFFAIHSACWFWKSNGCNEIADAKDYIKLTKRINGGTNGLEDRLAKHKDFYETLMT